METREESCSLHHFYVSFTGRLTNVLLISSIVRYKGSKFKRKKILRDHMLIARSCTGRKSQIRQCEEFEVNRLTIDLLINL